MRDNQAVDVAVIGGGIAGLTAAVLLARAGRSVTVFDTGDLGGRAATYQERGFQLNQGPHALYRAGAAARIFAKLEISVRGSAPASTGALALRGERLHRLPAGPGSLLTSDLFGLRVKLELGRFFAAVQQIDTRPLQHLTLEQWLAAEVRHEEARELLRAAFRLSTYANDPELLSAGAALEQFQIAREGVLYLDGGWSSLVAGLRDAALEAGAELRPDTQAHRVRHRDGCLELSDGSSVRFSSIIVTARPAVAAHLLHGPDAPKPAWAEQTPVRAACLDLGLRRLPQPEHLFALGLDRPYYFSVHSAAAKLAPEGGAVIHAAKYLPSGERAEPEQVEQELELLMDCLQPGWREEVVVRRYLPNMVVTNALVTAEMGGTAGRPDVDAAGLPGVFLAGDWVGPEGMLVDASVASAVRAAEAAMQHTSDRGEREYAVTR